MLPIQLTNRTGWPPPASRLLPPGVDFLPQRALVFDEAPFERVREHVRDQAQFLPGVYQVHHREPGPRRRDVRDDRHVLRVEAALPDESGSGA